MQIAQERAQLADLEANTAWANARALETQAGAIKILAQSGLPFDPALIVAAVVAGDLSILIKENPNPQENNA